LLVFIRKFKFKNLYMYSLAFYKKTILFYDIINKFQYNNMINIKTLNKKLQRVVISTKLTNDNEKKIFFILFVLEVYTLKKKKFNPKFTCSVRNGNYILIKSELRDNYMDFFLLKYLWIFSPILKKNEIKPNLKTSQFKNKNLFLNLNSIKHLEDCLNFKLNNKIYLNFLISSYEVKFLKKLFKLNFIC